ncbi:hypothetical protein ACFLZ3_04945 [Candidatus Omnitrophota bacterium]
MMQEVTIFDTMRLVYRWMSPVLFILGLALLFLGLDKYNSIEEKLGKEIGGIKKRVIPKLETNTYVFHQRLLEGKMLIGLLCIVCSAIFFFFLK